MPVAIIGRAIICMALNSLNCHTHQPNSRETHLVNGYINKGLHHLQQ